MADELIRILSDLHFGERISRVRRLAQLDALLEGVTHLVLNGDTLDTRPGPDPAHTAACREAVAGFFRSRVATTTFITGNHDADLSSHHYLEFAAGTVFIIHGDVFFDDIVPWSRDAPLAGRRIAEELAGLPEALRGNLDQRMAVFRRVALSIPQRHHSERRGVAYTLRYLADTVWPPHRIWRILHAWREMPRRAAEVARRHRPGVRFVLTGHVHRPGVWRTPGDIMVINTGSYSPPLGTYAVDLSDGRLTVRRVDQRSGEFHPGPTVAEFPLATPR